MLRIVESWDGCLTVVWEGSCSLGGERWDEKEEEGGEIEKECRQMHGYIMVFSDGITDGFLPLVIPLVTVPRYCTAISV